MTTEEKHEKEINRYLHYVNYLLRENNQLKDKINNYETNNKRSS